ncbi:MAG: radical SAM protein [Candidatus Aminicenantes bacterium]|nr:radical SAM protein [Candidatus Aminicenantes bacterium]
MKDVNCPPLQDWSIFFKEWLASNRYNTQLPISAVCNSRCLFCSNKLNPFAVATGMFRDVDDIKFQLSLMPIHQNPVRMSDSLPGRIAEGEAFLHPRFFDILKLVRRKYPTNTLCFTTNGSMLDEAFLKELAKFRPIEVTLSLHSTQPGLWARIFGKSEKEAATAIRSAKLLGAQRMDLQGTIVPLPKMCGWEDITRTYDYLAEAGAKGMIFYWPGWTVRTPPHVVRDMDWPRDEAMDFAERMRARHKIPLSNFPDLKSPLRLPLTTILKNTLKGNLVTMCGPFRNVLWLASEAAAGRLEDQVGTQAQAASVPNVHRVAAVKNRSYGGNIICAGLLMVEDFVAAGHEALERWPDTDLVLVPKIPFDNLYQDLMETPALRIAEELKKTVWVEHEDGTYNPLLSKPYFAKGDDAFTDLGKVMKDFNAGCQDESKLEAALGLIDAWPVTTSWGALTRDELRAGLLRELESLPRGAQPINQTLYLLDKTQAQCIETWPTKDDSVCFRRWTFLVKRNGQWRIRSLVQGEKQDLFE